MVSVDPSAIRFFKPPNGPNWYDVNNYEQYVKDRNHKKEKPAKKAKKTTVVEMDPRMAAELSKRVQGK